MTLTAEINLLASAVAAELNIRAPSPAAIIELATTPTGAFVGQRIFSTIHLAEVEWDGTRWRLVLAGWDGQEYDSSTPQPFPPTGVAAGTVVASAQTPGLSIGHIGVWNLLQSTTTNSGARSQTAALVGIIGDAGLMYRGVFIPVLLTATTTRMGFLDSNTVTDSTDGAYLEIIDTTGSFKTAAAGSRTTNATTFTVDVTTWYTVHIIYITSSSVRCIVVKDDGTVVLDVTNSTDIANTIGNAFCAGIISTNTGTIARVLTAIDYQGVRHA